MDISLKLTKDFERCLEDLKKKFGEDFEYINGLHPSQLDFSEFLDNFVKQDTMADATIESVEELIKTCGLYKTKAKDLIGIGKGITENFGGKVPDTIEELTTLSGVGRKTANLIIGDVYGNCCAVTFNIYCTTLCCVTLFKVTF